MLSNYKEKCEILVKNYIEQNTRRKLTSFTMEEYQEFIVDFKVEVTNELSVGYGKTIKAGSIKGNEKYFKKADFKNAIQHYIDKEFNKETNFQYLIDEISKGKYGQYDIEYPNTLLKGNNTILYEHYCPECKGEGQERCSRCQNGQVKCKAYNCKNGRVEKSKRVNGQLKKYYEDCSKCRGKGHILCEKCGGSAVIKCETCETKGITTTITRILINTVPHYKVMFLDNTDKDIQNAITQWSLPKLHLIASLKRESLQYSTSQKIITEIYIAKIPFAKLNVVYNGEKFAWFVYGTNLQILKSGDILNRILSIDINALIKVANKSFWCDTKILKKSQSAVATFMESSINKQIIWLELKSQEYETIDDRLRIIEVKIKENETLPNDYVKNVLQSFDKMAKRFCDGITLNYFIAAFVISFIVAFAIPKYSFLSSIVIFPFFIFLSEKHKKSAFKRWWGDALMLWVEKRKIIEIDSIWHTIIGAVAVFGLSYFMNLDTLSQQFIKTEQEKIKTQTKEKSPNTKQMQQIQAKNNVPQAQNEIQISSENKNMPQAVDYEQKFGKRIYLATKDDFVNMRNAPSGEVVAQIYKKDFESIMLYSFDTNSNEKWLKVMYFPPNVKDEQNAILGYIHISQIDKSKF